MHYQNKKNLMFISLALFISYIHGEKVNKEAVLVLGIARSGTSCVAGTLNILGVDFGDNFHPSSASKFNPKGDYEDLGFNIFLRELCKELDLKLHEPRIINWEKKSRRKLYKNKIKKFISEYKNQSFGLKLPFLTLLLPVFLEALEELEFTPKIIIVIRNPHETMKSWQNRWNYSQELIYSAFSTYYYNLLKYTRKYETLVIDFDTIIRDTKTTVDEINNFIPGLKSYENAHQELSKFIDEELKHHNS